jgi:hypothetical protein
VQITDLFNLLKNKTNTLIVIFITDFAMELFPTVVGSLLSYNPLDDILRITDT